MKLKETQILAQDLMSKHNLTDWNFQFDYSIRRFGYCNYSKKLISLSAELTQLNNEKIVTQIILHEIAHAIAPITSHHDKTWKEIASSIGYTGKRVYGYDVIQKPRKYLTLCRNGHTGTRSKKSRVSCGECSPRFNKKYLLRYSINPDFKPSIGIENI